MIAYLMIYSQKPSIHAGSGVVVPVFGLRSGATNNQKR